MVMNLLSYCEEDTILIPVCMCVFFQVLACVVLPELIQKGGYPEDVKKRATEILNSCG